MSFFFFQAEDGIRDYKVTGVQTCALPICIGIVPAHEGESDAVTRDDSKNLVVCPLPYDRSFMQVLDRKSTRLNSSHLVISYAVFCLKKKKNTHIIITDNSCTSRALGAHPT